MAFAAKKRNILLVEDDPSICDMLQCFLRSYNLYFVNRVNKAIKILDCKHIDIVLLDLGLPSGVEGFEVLDHIRKTRGLRHIYVIMLTVHEESENMRHALAFRGAFDYLIKNKNLDEVPIVVKKALKYQKILRESKGKNLYN